MRRSSVSKDSGVDSVGKVESSDAGVGQGSDSVIINFLVSIENERISLRGIELDEVDRVRFSVDSVHFDNLQIVLVDRERMESIKGHVYQTESVALSMFDLNNR